MANKGNNAMIISRMTFVIAVSVVAAVWPQLSDNSRFYIIICACVGAALLVVSDNFDSLCSKVLYFGWVVVAFAAFTAITKYEIAWRQLKTVDRSASLKPFVVGLGMIVVANIVRRLAARHERGQRGSELKIDY
jgi:hypothetical protein